MPPIKQPPKPAPPPKKPPPPSPSKNFVIVESIWVEGRRTVKLHKFQYDFSGTLTEAKASLSGKLFFSAKIYEKEFGFEELVATVRGTQTKQHPIS